MNDRTRQKKTTHLIHDNEDRFRSFVENSIDVIFILDTDGVFRFLSRSWEQHSGYSTGEMLGRPFATVVHPDDVQPCFDYLNRVMETGQSGTSPRFSLKCADGSWKQFIANGSRFIDVEGEALFHGIARDTSEQQHVMDLLKASEERYRRFIETANEGVGITDQEYRITYVNGSLAKMLGYEPAELIGIPVTDLLPPEEQADFFTRRAERRRGMAGRRECRHLRKDGSVVWLLTSATPILDSEGNFQGSFAMFTDLTLRMETEIALLKAHEELEHHVEERTAALAQANEQIKMMTFELIQAEERERIRIAGELHDQVGQTLLLIKMKLDMLASEIRDEQLREAASSLSFLLECSLQDIRSLTFNMRPPLLDTASFEVALEWLCASLKRDYGLQIDFHCSHKPLPLKIEVRYSIFQAVRELLLNVVKHARVDRAELSITSEADRILIRIIDQGSGFDLFDADKMEASANGFGLFNVRQRIEQIGGEFRITSAIGRGTGVVLYIPMAKN